MCACEIHLLTALAICFGGAKIQPLFQVDINVLIY